MKRFSDQLTDESKNNFIRTSAEVSYTLAMLNILLTQKDIQSNSLARQKLEEIKFWTGILSKHVKELESIELVLKEEN